MHQPPVMAHEGTDFPRDLQAGYHYSHLQNKYGKLTVVKKLFQAFTSNATWKL